MKKVLLSGLVAMGLLVSTVAGWALFGKSVPFTAVANGAAVVVATPSTATNQSGLVTEQIYIGNFSYINGGATPTATVLLYDANTVAGATAGNLIGTYGVPITVTSQTLLTTGAGFRVTNGLVVKVTTIGGSVSMTAQAITNPL
jgi:hypothetical protein